ncbi:MAG: transporter substrate-binding domain-containing protein [Lachnospiraceae bacterium]
MKILFATLLVTTMVFSLAACGSKETETKTEDKTAAEDNTTDDTAADDSTGTKKYTIATDTTFAPFEFEDESGNKIGIDMELLEAIAEDQGFEYELQSLGFNAAVQAVSSGQADGVIAGMSITEEREKQFDFSDAYFDSGVVMAVKKDSDITGYDGLKGQKVAVKTGTEGYTFAESIAAEYDFEMIIFDDSSSMYQDVITGNSVACFEDYPVIGYAITQGLELTMPTEKEQGSSYGFAVKKGENEELLQMFNDGLANLKESGKYQEILNTYIQE